MQFARTVPARSVAAAVGAALFLLSGCAVGPNYHPETLSLRPYRNAGVIQSRTGDTAAPALDKWWQGFNDPMLTRVVERALAQDLDLAAAVQRVEQARARAKEAGAQRLPNTGIEGADTTLRQSLDSPVGRYAGLFPGFSRNQSYIDLGIRATWESDLFGSLKRGAEAARAEMQAAEAERLGTRVSIVAEAADAYMQIRGAQARLAFAADQVATDENLVQLVTQRHQAGLASDRELVQAQALLAQAQATVPPLNIILEAQSNRLDVLMGAQPGTYADELQTPTHIPSIPGIAQSLDASDLLRRRPDIVAAERRVAASSARIGQALAEYYPKVSLSALIGSEALSPADVFRERAFQPTGVVNLRWRLFDFGRVDAEVKQARGANAEALLQYRKSVLRATEDVEDAFSALAQSELRSRQINDEMVLLQRAKDLSEQSYRAGVIPLTDVLDANRQLLVAKDELAESRESATRAAVASFRALGGGW